MIQAFLVYMLIMYNTNNGDETNCLSKITISVTESVDSKEDQEK